MTKNLNKIVATISFTALVLSGFLVSMGSAAAANVTLIGNDATSRTQVDTASNFTVVDMNHPATASNQITSISYYASNTNPFMFVLVDSLNNVKWVSGSITPATAPGANSYTLPSPVNVSAGDNLGLYFSSTGTIPFENTGATASWTSANSGAPSNGMILAFAGSGARTYSFVAYGTTTPAGTAIIGNDTSARTQVDTASNFTVVDMNHPATASNQITSISYYASNTNPFMFVLVDSLNNVKWVSGSITPATAPGANSYTLPSPVNVSAGDNLGLYFSSTGTIPFENTGATASWTSAGSGMPVATSTLSYAGSASRTYSFVAYGTTTPVANPVLTSVAVTPTSETLNIGGTQQLTANPMDQNSVAFSGATIAYSSSDSSVASVSPSGLVTGVSAGSATITVTATSGSTIVSATSAVTVNNNGNDNGNGEDNGDGHNRPGTDLRVRIILNMIKRLLAQLGITQTFTVNGMTF